MELAEEYSKRDFKMNIITTTILVLVSCCLIRETASKNVAWKLKGKTDVIEGDIMVDDKLKHVIDAAMNSKKNGRSKRDAVRYQQRKWKEAIIPYIIDGSVDVRARRTISLAIHELHLKTCLWFTPRIKEKDYIRIVSGEGNTKQAQVRRAGPKTDQFASLTLKKLFGGTYSCYSKVGRQGGEQIISVGAGCVHKYIIMHELMHAIGFFHENSRYDRDQYVKVLWWNIQHGAERNFLTYHHGRIDTLAMPYDINSLMHYDNKAFTKNYGDTIQALTNPNLSLGGNSLTATDVKQILLLYKCRKPKYRLRQRQCKDRSRGGCTLFISYPKLCNVHVTYILKNCRRTCRVCDASTSYR